jgi:hypothetical protein
MYLLAHRIECDRCDAPMLCVAVEAGVGVSTTVVWTDENHQLPEQAGIPLL